MAKMKSEARKSMRDFPEWVAALEKLQDATRAEAIAAANLQAADNQHRRAKSDDGIDEAARAQLAGTAVAVDPDVGQLRREWRIAERAKQLAESRVNEMRSAISAQVYESYRADHVDMFQQIGDHLATVKSIMAEEAELVSTLISDGVDHRILPRPFSQDTPMLFRQLLNFNPDEWNRRMKILSK
jgi:hypothetical protein